MTSVKQWDEWFVACGDEESSRAWTAAKHMHTDPIRLDAWATIIEMNRLNRLRPMNTMGEIIK
jgi:hypothetical protein